MRKTLFNFCKSVVNMSALVLDAQCCLDQSCELIIKELSALPVRGFSDVKHWIFLPPDNFMLTPKSHRVNRWLKTKFHGLRYSDGYIPYSDLQSILTSCCAGYDLVFVKGRQKKRLLSKYISTEIIDLEQLGCPKRDVLVNAVSTQNGQCNQCAFHKIKRIAICTSALVWTLRQWILDNPQLF